MLGELLLLRERTETDEGKAEKNNEQKKTKKRRHDVTNKQTNKETVKGTLKESSGKGCLMG